MSEPMTFQKKSRRERYIVRDDMSMGYEKDGFAFLTDRFVHSETVLVKYFADAKCEISAVALVKFSACAESEMK